MRHGTYIVRYYDRYGKELPVTDTAKTVGDAKQKGERRLHTDGITEFAVDHRVYASETTG